MGRAGSAGAPADSGASVRVRSRVGFLGFYFHLSFALLKIILAV